MAKDQRQLQGDIIIEALEVDMTFSAIIIMAVAELLVVWFFVDYGLDKTLKQEPMEILSMIR